MKKQILWFIALSLLALTFLIINLKNHDHSNISKKANTLIQSEINNSKTPSKLPKTSRSKQIKDNELEINVRLKECLSPKMIMDEFEDRKMYEKSYGNFSGGPTDSEMPEYWSYTSEELEQMSQIDNSEATFFLGIKMMYQSFGISKINNFYDLPTGIEVDHKMNIKSFSDDYLAEGVRITSIDFNKLKRARELLYQASLDGLIFGMFWRITSYDIERAYYEQNGEFNSANRKALKSRRLVDYFLLQNPFDAKFGIFDLRPHHLNHQDDQLNNEFNIAANQFNEDRNLKGYAPLFLNGYPIYWDDLDDCE